MFGKNTRLSLTQLVKFPKYTITDPTPDIIQIVIKRTKEKSEIRNQYKDRGKVFPQYTIGMNVLVKNTDCHLQRIMKLTNCSFYTMGLIRYVKYTKTTRSLYKIHWEDVEATIIKM